MSTGETRFYNSGSAAYGGVVPANPLSWIGGGWGTLRFEGALPKSHW